MASSDYCRRQAELLFAMVLATSDPALAERLRIRAEQFLAEAEVSADPARDFARLLEDFNNEQMKGP
jgi:hypothetical protein